MISVAIPAQASAPTLEFSLLNVEQGKTSSISMEFKTQGGPAQFKVKIFQRKGLFTSQNEMLSFEEKNSVVQTGALVGEASGVANSDVATRIRIPIDTANKLLGVAGYVAQITSGATEFGQLNFFLSSKGDSKNIALTPVSWIWPLLEPSHRNLSGVFIDDELATALTPQGRLGRLITAGEGRNFTWYIDPELIESVLQMTQPYQLINGKPGAGSAVATVWLSRLKNILVGHQVFYSSYGDLDLASYAQKFSPLELRSMIDSKVAQTDEILGVRGETSLAWPTDSRLNKDLLTYLKKAGFQSVIVDREQVPHSLNFTDESIATSDGLNLYLSDTLYSKYLQKISVINSNHLYSHLSMVTAERPVTPRLQIIVPPRYPSLDGSQALVSNAQFLTDEIPLSISARTGKTVVDLTNKKLKFIDSRITSQFLESQKLINQFAKIQIEPDVAVPLLRTNLIFSSSWIAEPFKGYLFATNLARDANNLERSVYVLSGSYTLTSLNGKVPISITNDSTSQIKARLTLRPTTFRLNEVTAIPIELKPKSKLQVLVPIRANSAGTAELSAMITDQKGNLLGEATALTIQVTSIPTVALWITWLAGAALLLAASLQIYRRLKRRGNNE